MNPAEIIKDHQQHFINRLLARNALLKLLPSLYREDMTVIIGQENINNEEIVLPVDILKKLISGESKNIKIPNVLKKNLAKFNKIKNESDDYFHSTGQLSFFLGFPFVHVSLKTEQFQFTPLFLWAITCKITNDSVLISRATDEDGIQLEPQINSIFKAWLAYEENITINWNNPENLNFETIISETITALAVWKKCQSKFDISNIVGIPNKDSLKATLEKPYVIPCAMLGHIKIPPIGEDFGPIIKVFEGDNPPIGPLDYFLKPLQTSNNENALKPIDNEKWLVTDYDYSQESVIWNTRKFNLMVLQGPPGTGKSQVIVNLIADAIANKKKVLVVCQKKAALEVIRKRLDANRLGELVQLIEDPQNDRMRIIKGIRAIECNFTNSLNLQHERIKTCKILDECESVLDKTNLLLSENNNGKRPNYGNLKARLFKLAQDGIDAYGKLNLLYQKTMLAPEWLPDSKNELEELLQETSKFLDQYRSCGYDENPYRHLVEFNNSSELRGLINQINRDALYLEKSDCDFYTQQNAWLAEHEWAIPSYSSFISHENLEIHEKFRNLVLDSKKLNKWLPKKYTDALLTDLRIHKNINQYSLLKELSGTIDQVLFVKTKLIEQKSFNFLFQNSLKEIKYWNKIIECFRYQLWLDELNERGDISKFIFEDKKYNLQKALHIKRDQDVQDILSHYSQRIQARNDLMNSNLLRIRSSNNSPKSTLRKIYTLGFDTIHQLYPVLLTNPNVVSSILELRPNLYDLVIIDEASQMYMAEALPILYRAKAVFLSGDSQQMPPSDFFVNSSNTGNFNEELDTDDIDEENEENSIDKNRLIAADGEYCLLDAAEYAVKKGNPNHAMLSVHYRSEFKELIDFSNHAFYEGKLITAVSNKCCPIEIKSPIELNIVENASAKAGVNYIEALNVVERIAKLWQEQNTYSLGVITLNVKQKDQIDDLLFARSQLDAKFQSRLEQERNRTELGEDVGFFVRSVENVQGDERDLIIFSTSYDGVKRNFGAISRKEKGRKRLNVAVTRAKKGMIIYTSLNIDAISNESQRDETESYWFWQYMRYARAVSNKDSELVRIVLDSLSAKYSQSATDIEPDSFFEEDVADFLRGHNFHVDYQIGESGFKIDLGVKRNIEDSNYLCGLECDGRQYHSSWSARLNDIWRQNILENKGWKIVRIWSNDWFDNRDETQLKLLEDLKRL